MHNIINLTEFSDFSNLTLDNPNGLKGGSYLAKLNYNNLNLYLQLPKCTIKNGIIITERKSYCDLMFEYNEQLALWFEELQESMNTCIYNKRQLWFEQELDMDDISNAFVNPIKLYKGGKYLVMRAHFPKDVNMNELCYNEDELTIPTSTLNNPLNICIPIIELVGIKFTAKSFQIDIVIKQIMVLSNISFSQCRINNPKTTVLSSENNSEESKHMIIAPTIITEPLDNAIVSPDDATLLNDNAIVSPDDATLLNDNANVSSNNTNLSPDVFIHDNTTPPTTNNEIPINNEQVCLSSELNSEIENKNNLENIDNSIIQSNDLGKNNYNLEEVIFDYNNTEGNIKIENRKDIYLNLWKTTKERAKVLQKEALKTFLEAKEIQKTYLLDDLIEISDEEDNLFIN